MRCRSGKEFLYADEYVLAYRRSLGFCHRSNRNFEFYQFHPYRNHYQAERICHDGGHRNDEEAADKMVIAEGLYYAILTVVFSLVAGVPILLALGGLVPYLAFRFGRRGTVVEELQKE